MTFATSTADTPRTRLRLRLEFALFFMVAPVTVAVFFPARWMFPLLGALTLVGLVLLALTPGFRWRELAFGAGRASLGVIAGVAAATLIAGFAVLAAFVPRDQWFLIQSNPSLMLAIAALYPFLSALPQELVYRPLFFRRYEAILPDAALPAIILNATLFSLAHLMYWSLVVAVLTFAGGLVFAYSYRLRGSFPEAVIAHSVAGVILFALGLGVFFYSGNVTRPF